jgi:uncharacterized protein (DUF427 family)
LNVFLKKHLPDWIIKARAKWQYTGKERPDFAITPKDGQMSVWDFSRPPTVKSIKELVRVLFKEDVLVKTNNALAVCETANPPTVYIPPTDVNINLLVQIKDRHSWCEWKGKANYWALKSNPNVIIAWTYEAPFDEYKMLKKYFSFYPQTLDCFIGEEKVQAQKSTVYAGWVIKNLVGPFKGAKGTEHW